MTLKRKVYFAPRKNRGYVYETKQNGRTTHLIDLPRNHYKFLKEMCRLINGLCPECQKLAKSCFLDKDKWLILEQKLASADYCLNKDEKEGI